MAESTPLALLARFETGHYRPVTFLQRGVALPFTTPHLLGGRIRPGEMGSAELVLPNPVGQDGAYIMPWSALPDICTPTLHDQMLWSRTLELGMLAPRTVREAARRVASDGYAGRAAARAATAANQEDTQVRIRTHYHMLLELVRQGEGRVSTGPPPERESLRSLEGRARAVLKELDAGEALSAAAAFDALAEVAEAFAVCGLPRNPTGAPVPALVGQIGALIKEITAWAANEGSQERSCVRLLAQSAELTLRCSHLAMARAQAPLADLPGLLRHWWRERANTLTLLARPEWLLDGWNWIVGLWRTTAPGRRGLALLDMAVLVPVMPSEVGEWLGFNASTDMETYRGGLRQWRRKVQPNEDWMTGRFLDLVARNEGLRVIGA